MTMMAARVFCDTNIVLRSSLEEMPEHVQVRAAIGWLHDSGTELWISRQIIREFCAVLTRPQTFTRPLPSATVLQLARAFPTSYRVADETAEVTTALLALLVTIPCGGKQVHDARLMAICHVYGISHLLTFNIAHFSALSKFGPPVVVVDPAGI